MVNDTQQIPEGYKQTDVGVIPEDWDTSTLEEVSSKGGLVRGPFGGSLKKEMFKKSGYKVYEQRNAIYKNVFVGNYYVDEEKYRQLKRFSVQNNDFIVSCSGTIGKLFQIPKKHPAGIINQALLLMRLDPKKIDLDYFSHYFEWDKFQTRIIDNTQGGAMKNLVGMDVFRETLIPHPNQISEQSNIAKVLSGIDSLISKLDQLIQKKKNIKQGAMQELLTGKRRLPGFSGEWMDMILGDVASIYQPQTISQNDFSNDGYIVYGANGIVGKYHSYNHGKWQTIITCRGSTCGTVNKTTNNCWITGNAMVMNVDLNNNVDKIFFYHLLRNQDFSLCITGSGQPQIVRGPLYNYGIKLPTDKNEQIAIAQVLTDMDIAINTLIQQQTKYQNLKQGMMQQLLTGKIRLI